MPARVIRADYQQLAQISKQFSRQSGQMQATLKRLQAQMQTLHGGDWIGRGATAFYQEMDSQVLPSLKRLTTDLQAASQSTLKMSRIMKDAENRSAALFRFLGSVGPAADGRSAMAGAGEGREGEGGGEEESLYEKMMAPFESKGFEAFEKGHSAFHLAEAFASKIKSAPKWLHEALESPAMKVFNKGFSLLGEGLNIAKFAHDPNLQTGADLTSSSAGVLGAFAENPWVAGPAAAFSGGYAFGKAFIAPYTTKPLSNLLTKWDPLDLNDYATRFPKTTIHDYQRHGQDMPIDVAGRVFNGLNDESRSDAVNFAKQYASQHSMSVNQFFRKSGHWYLAGIPLAAMSSN